MLNDTQREAMGKVLTDLTFACESCLATGEMKYARQTKQMGCSIVKIKDLPVEGTWQNTADGTNANELVTGSCRCR